MESKKFVAKGRRKQAKPQRKQADEDGELLDVEESSLSTEDSSIEQFEEMSPDSNYNMHVPVSVIVSNKRKFLQEDENLIEDDQVLMEAMEAIESAKVLNGMTHSDDSQDYDQIEECELEEQCDKSEILDGGHNVIAKRCSVIHLRSSSVSESDTVPLMSSVAGNTIIKQNRTSPILHESSYIGDDCFKCSQCMKICPGFDHLKEHVQLCHPSSSEHGAITAFSCVQCSATFTTRELLEKHEILHSPNAQVSCKVCNKTFANVYRLQRHTISHDESAALRKFKCPQCEKAFKFKHHLKEHIRIHSGEKPFECTNCGKRFSHSGSYSSHMTSKKCLIMNLKVNHRNRTTDPKQAANIQQHLAAYTAATRNAINGGNKKILPATMNINNNNNNSTSFNNNANPQKFNESSILVPTYTTTPNGATQFYLTGGLPLNSNLSYGFPPSLNHLIEQLSSSQQSNERKSVETGQDVVNSSDIKIETENMKENDLEEKQEIRKDVTENGNDLEAVKRILETVNVTMTKQLLAANMQKFSSASCSSGCPSISSEVHSPSVEEQQSNNDHQYCRYCNKTFLSGIELHQHERYLCTASKNEGLAAKLEEAMFPHHLHGDTNGACYSESDDDSHDLVIDEEETMEEINGGRKGRVRTQITEDQLTILKSYYSVNIRPKREELESISQRVRLPLRVVKVWFQNSRSKNRVVQHPVINSCASYDMEHADVYPDILSPLVIMEEEPLDLSTKKSYQSSPAGSQYCYDSDDYASAMNLTRKSSPNHFHESPVRYSYRSPSPNEIKTSPSLHNAIYANGNTPALLPISRVLYMNSYSPAASNASPNDNGSCSPNSSDSRSCKQESTNYNDFMEYINENQMIMAQEKQDRMENSGPIVKRQKMNHSSPTDNESDQDQRPHKCVLCPKAFKHKHHLTEHKRLHSGEKPYQCSKCLKRFSHSGSYSQHMNHRFSYCKPYRD